MIDLAKGVLEGAWSLFIGWMLPVFGLLQLATILIVPVFPQARGFADMAAADQQLSLLFCAVLAGFILAAVKRPLYMVLEGYLMPESLKKKGKARHIRKRQQVLDKAAAEFQQQKNSAQGAAKVMKFGQELGAMRYPMEDSEVAPTALGNAIRRFETYGADRYGIDSQFLFHQLAASCPEYARQAQERARTYVDFAVCVVWTNSIAAAVGFYLLFNLGMHTQLLVFTVVVCAATVLAYKLAVLTTDEWAATVRLQVDFGRAGVAEAFGMKLPNKLQHERLMWQSINLFTRTPRDRSSWLAGDPDYSDDWITMFRSLEEGSDAGSPKTSESEADGLAMKLLATAREHFRAKRAAK